MYVKWDSFLKLLFIHFLISESNPLEVLLTGADVGLVALRSHVDQLGQVSHNVGRQTEAGVPDRDDVSVPQDAGVCPIRNQTHVNWERLAGGGDWGQMMRRLQRGSASPPRIYDGLGIISDSDQKHLTLKKDNYLIILQILILYMQ